MRYRQILAVIGTDQYPASAAMTGIEDVYKESVRQIVYTALNQYQTQPHDIRDDSTVPLAISERYAAEARRKGDDALVVPLAGGHFELVDPARPEWEAVRDEISRIVMSSSSSAV